MSDWLERVEKEHDDLAEKVEKLHRFLKEVESDEEKRKAFNGWQLQLMKIQFDHMLAYLHILNLRIEDVE
nr:MAG TPA: hypothetical protein [Caudoviricetes sp.]